MSDDHKDVLIAAYLFEDLAEKDFDAIVSLAEDGSIVIEGVALVQKDPDGEVHVKQTGDHLGRKGAQLGAALSARLHAVASIGTWSTSLVKQICKSWLPA